MDKLMKILHSIKPNVDFSKQQNLLESGVLTSFDIIRLVAQINSAFDIEITPLHTLPENFNSVEAIYRLIQRLQEDD